MAARWKVPAPLLPWTKATCLGEPMADRRPDSAHSRPLKSIAILHTFLGNRAQPTTTGACDTDTFAWAAQGVASWW